MISKIALKDRNKTVQDYMPLARRIAVAFWTYHKGGSAHTHISSTQKQNGDTISLDELISAANGALVQGRDSWDPLKPSCGVSGCVMPTEDGILPSGPCIHGGPGYTFGAFIETFIKGACLATLKKAYRKKQIPYVEELMPFHHVKYTNSHTRPSERALEYERLPTLQPLQDGSEYEGSPSEIIWPSYDLKRLRIIVDQMLACGDIVINGLNADQVHLIVAGFYSGAEFKDIAQDAKCTPQHVQDTADCMRDLLSDTDYAIEGVQADEARDNTMSLSTLASLVTAHYPHDPCQPKRMGEWLTRGWVPARQTADGRWVISYAAARIAITRWGDRKSRCVQQEQTKRASKELDKATPSDRIFSMSKGTVKPARILTVVGHTATRLPEYGDAPIGPVTSIEVGQGRALSWAVTAQGDRFYGRNRETVLTRFGLEQTADGYVRPMHRDDTYCGPHCTRCADRGKEPTV